MKSQLASPTFTPTYAALVAIINTKFPEIGELLLKRVISQVCAHIFLFLYTPAYPCKPLHTPEITPRLNTVCAQQQPIGMFCLFLSLSNNSNLTMP